jgi:hypothetical protein
MSLFSSLLLAAVLAPTGNADSVRAPARSPSPTVTITVDSARHEITITAGPFDLKNMPPMEEHAMMDHGAAHDTPVQRFQWPVEGWFRGFRIELSGAGGTPVPRHVMHHMIMVNFDRRQLLYSAAERLLGAGTETDDAVVPKTIGVPLAPGMNLGLYVAWHNDTGKDLEGVHLKLTMLWTPKNQNPQPANAMPIYMDVNLTVGGSNTYDVPPGKSTKAYEFQLPIGGHLLGVGGHMHDYGVGVRLEDMESGKVLTRVAAKRQPDGKLLGMQRRLFGVSGAGLKLKANHRYRVVGEYDNPTGETLVKGAMAHMVGLFVPDDMAGWPAIDPTNADFQRDLASLDVRGEGEDEGEGEAHEHGDGKAHEHDEGESKAHDHGADKNAHEGHTEAATQPK